MHCKDRHKQLQYFYFITLREKIFLNVKPLPQIRFDSMCITAENPDFRLARGLFAPLAVMPPVANALVALGIERREHRGSQ